MKLYTNDLQNASKELYGNLFEDGHFVEIGIGEPIVIDEKDEIVFDFGGYIDNRVADVAKYVDACIVPISYVSQAECIPTLRTINALRDYNKKIIILINNTNKALVPEIKDLLKKKYPKFPIFVVNSSKYVSRLANYQKTIFDLAQNASRLEKYWLNKTVVPQFENFYQYLENLEEKK